MAELYEAGMVRKITCFLIINKRPKAIMEARLTIAEVKKRLSAFVRTFKDAKNEQREATIFWTRFYECYGIRAEEATIYEQAVRKLSGERGRIDSFIPGLLIVEHKSKGKSLDIAYEQASDYFLALPEQERPKYIVTSDFARLRLYDLVNKKDYECTLQQLPAKAGWFKFLLGNEELEITEETPINRDAAYAISKIHETLLRANFKGRDLEVFLTRLLFCMFADDTGIFGDNNMLRRLVEGTREDGADLGAKLTALFDVFDQAITDRQTTLDDELAAFPYINGALFKERTRIPSFDSTLREHLISCVVLDWSAISPAIFGAMFQGVLEEHEPDSKRQATRRELGAHYTSERNILRVINPLFMDDLRSELEGARRSKPRLQALYDKLPNLNFFDPACGCGNFLVIAYRELRRLEFEVISELFNFEYGRGLLDIETLCRVQLNQFYGIEIDEAAAHIARVALYITDHQLNTEAAARFGNTRATVPLVHTPNIVCDNALRVDWCSVLDASKCSYIISNPPFIGYSLQTKEQKEDLEILFSNLHGAGVLDYVCGWYEKAAVYLNNNNMIECAFVSTNSITQGEQPAILWRSLLSKGVVINFAHRTFRWSNEGKGVAAVHCVVIGFAKFDRKVKKIYEYEDIQSEPIMHVVKQINAYLIDAPSVLLDKRSHPIQARTPELIKGSQPTDGGHLLLTKDEADYIKKNDTVAAYFLRKFLGADEFLNNTERYCLWLVDSTAEQRKSSKVLKDRIDAVKRMRLASKKAQTQLLAESAYLFGEIRQTNDPYILIPRHSSENRKYIPFGFFDAVVICGDANSMIPNASIFDFGILTSTMHMAWVRLVCGRIKSDFRYSNTIVYNNYPFPVSPSKIAIEEIEKCATAVLEARKEEDNKCAAANMHSSLAAMYVSGAMPIELSKAHKALDKAVDKAYGYKGRDDDASRVAYLFKLYEELTSLLPTTQAKRKGKKTAS